MILSNKKWITVGEAWFGEAFRPSQADLVYVNQNPEPLGGFKNLRFETLILDLRQTEAELSTAMVKGTWYEIRRAQERDELSFAIWASPEPKVITEFCAFFSAFSKFKGLGQVEASRLLAYQQAGQLTLSRISKSDGQALSWHAYVVGSGRARLLYSASFRSDANAQESQLRSLIGRANRFLHWRDLLHFKASGFEIYDLGGWYPGGTDAEKLNINRFKEGFGGVHESSFNAEVPLNLRGSLYLQVKKIIFSILGR